MIADVKPRKFFMHNPFRPGEIVSLPGEFFGRDEEIRALTRSVKQGRHVAVAGPIGIGKSSLVSRLRLELEGFATGDRCGSVLTVGHKGIASIDDAAHLVLSEFVTVDGETEEFSVNVGSKIGFRFSSKVAREYFKEGRHLAVLQEVLLKHAPEHTDLLLIIVDEVDKCSIPITQMFRAILTKLQFEEVKNIRFVFAGVGSYLQDMMKEDQGIGRFLAKPLSVNPLPPDDAEDLISTKLEQISDAPENGDRKLEFSASIIRRLVELSGGHPQVLQYLGYHLVEQEFEDPDGVLSVRDLIGSFRRICYEDRGYIYDPLIHKLRQEGMLESLKVLFYAGSRSPPTYISRDDAINVCDAGTLEWFVDNDIFILAHNGYRLVDEFIRVRVLTEVEDESIVSIEGRLLLNGAYVSEEQQFKDDYLDDYPIDSDSSEPLDDDWDDE
ncbi:AAA family ATPase [Crateriforma spongiae]|uniref:nSTAND1 domain-containing NTPase n=1 Tax=Crateriforma spongiae TaxID=2724528 RepID=UPI0039AE9BF0